MSEEKAYIYELIDPRTGEPRYVGKTDNLRKRMRQHIRNSSRLNYPVSQWIRKLKRLGLEPIMQVIEECDGAVWAEREMFWIARYRELGYRLLNCNDGGMGGHGHSPSKETRRKKSEAMKGRPSPNKGKIHSLEARRRNSEAHKGKRHSLETRKKMSQTHTGRCRTPETRHRMSKAKKKRIAQFTLNGQFIRYWDSAKDAGIYTSINRRNITTCCKRRRKSSGGYIWRYADDPLNADEIFIGTPDHQLSLFDDDPTGDDE